MQIEAYDLYWLAGLLEGEGHFSLTPATKRNAPTPCITLVMKDQDVVEHAAVFFKVSVTAVSPRKSDWHTTYLTRCRGKRAYQFMCALQPLMSLRRQELIQSVLEQYVFIPNHIGSNNEQAKLNESQVIEIKQRITWGETAKQIAHDYGVSHHTIWAIRSGKTWSHVTIDGSVQPLTQPDELIIVSESEPDNTLYWLAGLLEGEGSFTAPAPSEPKLPRISIEMTDEDVVQKAAGIFGVKYHRIAARKLSHQDSFKVNLKGRFAYQMMKQLYPLLSKRRQTQIDNALKNYEYTPRSKGARNPSAKLDESSVRKIRARLKLGDNPASIAAEYCVSQSTIVDIKLKRTWKDV